MFISLRRHESRKMHWQGVELAFQSLILTPLQITKNHRSYDR
jgi:hypothetical protein